MYGAGPEGTDWGLAGASELRTGVGRGGERSVCSLSREGQALHQVT